MINRQDSRHKIKRSSFSGVVPTIHTASNDFTDGTWLNTDLREAEFFYNIPDKKLWIGTGTSSIEIAQIGSTTSGNSLEQTLAIGNDSGLQSIIMGTGTYIKSKNGGGRIDLDAYAHANTILITTDDAAEAQSVILLDSTNVFLASNGYTETINLYNGAISQQANTIDIKAVGAGIVSFPATVGNLNLGAGAADIYMASNVKMGNNTILNFDTYTTFKNTNSGLLNVFDIKSSVTTATASVQLTSGLSATIISTVQGPSYATSQELSFNGGNKMTNTTAAGTGTTYQKIGAVSTTTVGTFSMVTIGFMNDDQSFSIRGQANGYCASPNRNMGATFYASFLKYGGTIHQNGTTDIVLKDGYGDGTTPAVWTDGTNIYISVRTFSALTSTFTTSYEILV